MTTQNFKNPDSFFALTQQSTSLVMAEVGNLKLDPSALKCQNSFFFFEFLFMHPVAYIDTLKMSLYTSIWNSFTESGINKIWERRWNFIWYSYQKMYYINVPLVFRYFTYIQGNISPPMTIHIHLFPCRGLFSRSSQKEPVPAWKLFGKVPIKDARESSRDPHNQPSSFDRGEESAIWSHFFRVSSMGPYKLVQSHHPGHLFQDAELAWWSLKCSLSY